MIKDEVIRLLIADESVNDAEMIISVLRNAGHAVRATRVEDDEDLLDALGEHPFELFLCPTSLEALPLADGARIIRESGRDLPMLAVADSDDAAERLRALQEGAVDLVSRGDTEHLQLVVRRELGHLSERRRVRHLEKALRESERRASALLDSSRDAIAYVHDGMHVYANRAYLERVGVEEFEEIEGMPMLDMIAPEDQKTFKELLRSYDRGDRETPEATVRMAADEGITPVQVNLSAASVDGEPCVQVLIREETGQRDLEEKLDSIIKQDLLTGLYNRTHFLRSLDAAMEEGASNEERNDGLLYLQIDNLDGVRQNLGLAACDQVITDVAGLVSADMDADCLAGRFADDAITILLPHRGVHETVALGEAIRERIENHIVQLERNTVTVTCTIGALMLGDQSHGADQAVMQAYEACEKARSSGGNQVHLYSAAQTEGGDMTEWRDTLEQALETDGFRLVYMPMASLSGDTVGRYEVRLRLQDSNGREILPADFVRRAEELGLMPQIDRWVVDHALRAAGEPLKQDPDLTLFIKLSGNTLGDEGFLEDLGATLKRHGIAGKHLNFEVNEPVALTQLNEARAIFRGLKELGCGFTIDHFGSGLNPFQLVKHLPADYLKLDRSLGQELLEGEEAQEQVRELIRNAHELRKQVVAGYVEDAMTMAIYWRCQVDFVQGHFLQEPAHQMTYDFTGTVI